MKTQTNADSRIEVMIGSLLRTGVLIAAAVVIIGGSMYAVHHCKDPMQVKTFHGEAPSLRSPAGVLAAAFQGNARAIIQLGLLLLVATPVARVVFSAVAFALEGDRLYVGLTLVVLVVLAYSLFGPVF